MPLFSHMQKQFFSHDATLLYLVISGSTNGTVNIRHEENLLEGAVKELIRARTKMKVHLLRSQQDIKRRLDRANILATTGGSPGELEIVLLVSIRRRDNVRTGQLRYVKLAYLENTTCVEVTVHSRTFPLYFTVYRPCLCQTRL